MANNQYVNKVEYGGSTVIDISDTTAEAGDVIQGMTFYAKSGAQTTGTLGDATTTTHGLMSAADKIKLNGISIATVEETQVIIDEYGQGDDGMLVETSWYADPNDSYSRGWKTVLTATELAGYIKQGKQLIFHIPANETTASFGLESDSYLSLASFTDTDEANNKAANFVFNYAGFYDTSASAPIDNLLSNTFIDENDKLYIQLYVD